MGSFDMLSDNDPKFIEHEERQTLARLTRTKEASMTQEKKKFPLTISGLYKNTYSEKFSLNSVPLDQENADKMCAAIQACVGGRLEVKEMGGVSKNGKKLPDYFLEGVTAEILAERKAFGAQKKAEREAPSDRGPNGFSLGQGDDSL